MEMMKRMLALLLVFAMLMPNLTTIAKAADTEEISGISTEPVMAAEETEAPPEATEPPMEETEPPTEETEPPTEATEPPMEETEAPTEATEPPMEETEAPAEETEVPAIRETITVEETVTDPVASGETDAELLSGTLTVEDTAVPDSDYSNDVMFAMYVDRVLYPNEPSTLGTGGYDNLPAAALKNLYTYLKEQCAAIADNGGYAAFTLSTAELEELGFQSTITAETMGIEGRTNVSETELKDLVDQHLGIDLSAVVSALLADCPYELYWYDKVSGSNMGYSFTSWAYESGAISYVEVDNLEIVMTVADNYVGTGDHQVASTAAKAAASAAAKAQDVVDDNASRTDLEKLNAYKQWIMEEVSYDHDAADRNDFSVNDDPWQIIYVFDGDENTNVVCEGYAKAFQYLCDLSEFEGNVESFLVTGHAGGAHMWNIVSIDGRNYMVDVTNTDPDDEGVFGDDGSVFLAGASGSIADGYIFRNSNGNELTYTYTYWYDGEDIQPAIDVYGDGEDSILNLSFLGYEQYLDISAGQEELLNRDYLEGDIWIVDDVELRELGDVSNVNLTVSGATLKLAGYTSLSNCSITLENGARLLVEGDLYLRDGTTLNLGEDTFLQINGDADNRQGAVYVQSQSRIVTQETSHILVPDGAIYADFYAVNDQVPGIAPGKLTVQTWVMDQSSLRDSVNDMDSEKDKYHRYEIIADHSFAIEEDIVIPGPISFEVRNWGDWNDPVVLTVPEGKTLTIGGCYMGIYEGTQLHVEGTVMNGGYLRTHANSAMKITGSGVLNLAEGTVDNQGIIYAPSEEHLIFPENADWDYWQSNDPIFAGQRQEAYLSLRWLDNYGHGWFENQESNISRELHIAPGEQYYMIAYLNQWNEGALRWEATPIHAGKLVTDGNLVLEPFRDITDGGNHTQEGENFDCFFRVRAADGAMDVNSSIAYSNTGILASVTIGRHAGGFYSENPVGADADSLWINEFRVGGSGNTFWFWFDPSKYHEEGWNVGSVKASPDRDIGGAVQVSRFGDNPNLYTVTISDEAAANIYALRDFWLNLEYTLVKGEDSRNEGAGINCRAADFGEPNASFDIDGVRYNASWNYDGLFRYEQDGNGDWYPVPAEIEGVSYDIHSNTLTLNGAHLETLYIDHHWYDDRTGEEGWNLPDGRFNIKLVGDDNTINATDDHALVLNNDVYLTILGEGSLTISSRNASSAFQANDSDVTIAGNAKVDVSISGEVFYEDNGETRRKHMNAIWCNGTGRWLRLRDNAVLTTHVPEGVCTNGYFDQDGNFVEEGGYNGLQFSYIEVNDNATLNTQIIRVWDEGLGNAFGAYYQNGGTVNVTGLPHYNKDNQNENGTVGHYHFSGVEADYGQIEINGGVLNININATEEQMAKSVYYHGLQSRGRRIDLNGGEINITGNTFGTGIKVGEDNWDGGTNAWVNFNNTTLNMTGSDQYRTAVDVAPNGSIYFNGGKMNLHRANIQIRGHMTWNGTKMNQTESSLNIAGGVILNGGHLAMQDGVLRIQEGGVLDMRSGYVELNNSFSQILGSMKMESGALIQSLDFQTLDTTETSAQAMVVGEQGWLEICGDAYLEITGISSVDGIYNAGGIRKHGGSLIVDVDETVSDTWALFGPGTNRFESGNVYLNGYNGLVQFNKDEKSRLYVGGNAILDAFGRNAGIVTYAPAEFDGGYVTAFATGSVQTVTDQDGNTKTLYPTAVLVENNADDTNASLTITGGNHYFASFDEDTLAEGGRGLQVMNAPFAITGGALDVEAEMAVCYVPAENGETSFNVPVIISNETGSVLTMTYSDVLEAQTLFVGEQYARSVAFRQSQNCGENVKWNFAEGVLTISVIDSTIPGNMENYHMPANDPASWRVAPWYVIRDSITKVVVEEGVSHIGDWAFGRLPEVTEIVYSSTVNRIDMTSNYDCPKLEKFTVSENNEVYSVADDGKVLIENGSLVRAAVKGVKTYRAADGITTIGMGAFDSTALEELDLNQVQIIQNYAFADCYNLKNVVIPDGVTTIEMTVFQNSGLESITIPKSVTKIRNYAFDGCSALTDVYYTGSEAQWNSIVMGSGNNALIYVPVIFLGTSEEVAGEPFLSYHMVKHDGTYWFEDTVVRITNAAPIKLMRDYYVQLVVYLNVWNETKGMWDHIPVDPADLYSQNEAVEIFLFRSVADLVDPIREMEPNADSFIEVSFLDQPADDFICYDHNGTTLKLEVQADYQKAGFYSQKVDLTDDAQLKQYAVDKLRINPNDKTHSIYFGVADSEITVTGVTVSSETLSEEELAMVTVTAEGKNLYCITVADSLADKVYEYEGFDLDITYTYGEGESETWRLWCFPVGLNWDNCISFAVNGIWYEYFPGVEGFFWWDEANQIRHAEESLPGGMTYDYENDILTMNNSTIESLQVYWNWHNEDTGESGFATKDNDLTLKLIGENKIVSPYRQAALAVGDGLTLTITGDENSSLLISATNEYATQYEFSANAVNIYNDGDLIIAGDTSVTTFIGSNENMTEGWLMNLWGGGNNTLTLKDNATLTTTVPAGARDDGDGRVNGYEGIGWFGEIRVQDNATLNTSTLGLGEYYDEHNNYHGKGGFVQTGGNVTIEALGFTNEEGRHSYHGLMINGENEAIISGGKLTVKANAANVAADKPGEEDTSYAWFDGIQVNGHLDISGEDTVVEIVVPDDGTALGMNHTETVLRDGAVLKVTGNGSDVYGLDVGWNSNFQLNGGNVDITDAKVRVMEGATMEIHDGTLSVVAKDHPHQTYLETWQNSAFFLHNGTVTVDNGITEGTHDAVSVGGDMELNGGTMTVSGNNALGVQNNAGLYQNGAELTVNGFETTLTCGDNGEIHLNGGVTEVILGRTGDGGELDMGGMMARSLPGTVINSWSAAVNIYSGGRMEVNDGDHTFRVAGTPGQDSEGNPVWLCAMDINGSVDFNGGTVMLDAGYGGNAIFNRTPDENSTVSFNHDLGAVETESGVSLDMYFRGENEELQERYFSLGTETEGVSTAKLIRTSAGSNAFWHIEEDGENTTLVISGDWDMYNYYMPENDPDWNKTPWFDDYNHKITHVIVEEGINNVGDWVFARMTSLKNVKLPGTVNYISSSAFYGCTALESFTMQGNENVNLDEDTCGEPDENGYRTGTVILEGGWKVLKAAATVTEYTVPAYISEIGNGAFRNCTDLTSIVFETHEDGRSDVWNIGNNAFENTGLTRVELPEGVQAIGRYAFADNGSLAEIVLPQTVGTIRPYAFSGCGALETVIFAGSESQWNQIAIGTGNTKLVVDQFLGEETESGDDYLSFRWADNGENGWEENPYDAVRGLSMPADFFHCGVFYYNHWDGTKWVVTAVDPEDLTVGSGIAVRKMDDQLLEEYEWQIAEGESNGAKFAMLTSAPDSWGGDGTITYEVSEDLRVTMNVEIRRERYGFYSTQEASDETWLNDYEMNPLKVNEFYFIFENSEHEILDPNSVRMWNHNDVPESYFRCDAMGNGVYRITLDPIFMQDSWQYGYGVRLCIGFDVADENGENGYYTEASLQLKVMDLGRADAVIEINDQQYLYFAEQNGWMTNGDPANDWRPGVAYIPAGVSYSYNKDTGEQILTLNNAKLDNLSLNYRGMDENGELTEEKRLPNENLTIHLVGSSLIESGHREALNINGGLNVTVTGTGSLKLHSHNDPETRDEWGNRYAFDTVAVGKESTLTIAGGNVTAEISGEGFWHEGNPAMPAALRGRDDGALVVSGGSLTTVVPENARDNGPEEVDFEHYYSTHAISEFRSITVSGGILNTTSLYVNEGETYTQTGGTANITGLGHISRQWDEYGNQHQNYHYNGLQVQKGAEVNLSGGELNLTVTPRDWEHGSGGYYSGLSIAGGEAIISGDAKIHVTGAFEGCAVSVHNDYDENGQPCANGSLSMTGGTLTLSNEVPGSWMNGLEVGEDCTATISGGILDLTPEGGIAGIGNNGELTIGGTAQVYLTESFWSNGQLTVKDSAAIDVTHEEGTDMYAWDIVPGSRFDFESGTITAKNAAFMIGGEMWIQEGAELNLVDSDFNADGAIMLNGGSLTMSQADLVDNRFIGTMTDEWGNTWDEYEYQSRLNVTGVLNLNSGELELTNVRVFAEGSAVINQNGAAVTINNAAAAQEVRESDDADSNDWMEAVHIGEDVVLNVDGGSFTVTSTDLNCGINARGTLNMRDGVLNVSAPDGIAIAARGQNMVSGGEMILSGWVGYEQAYEEGFEQSKLTVTGGSIDIDAVNTGFDLYNDLVVTGGNIDIDISGYTQTFDDEKGQAVTMLGGCGIMGYNDYEKVSISINGGTLNIDAPVDVPAECNAVSVFGILGGRNATVRINGGDIGIKAKTALYAESQDNAKHIVINNRLYVLSMETGNTLDLTSGVVEVDRDGETYIWYVDTYEEDEEFTTPYDNMLMDGYATNLRIVSKTAGTNAFWDMEDGILTISAPGGKVGTMVKDAGWNRVADKVTKLVLDPSIDKSQVNLKALDLMTGLQSVKTPHDSHAEAYAKENGIGVEYFHDLDDSGKCAFSGCANATLDSTLNNEAMAPEEKKEAIQAVDKEELKQELEKSEDSAQQFEQLDQDIQASNPDLAVEIKPAQPEDGEHKSIAEILDVPEDAKPKIIGAALNAEEDSKEVALVIGTSSQTDAVDETLYEKVVRFSMELTVTDTGDQETAVEELKTPVQVTLPLPNGMEVDRLVILHYHDESGEPEEVDFIHTTVGGQVFVSFWITGFSDFDFLMKAVVKPMAQINQKGRNLLYEDTISVVDIFELKNAEGIDLNQDAGLLIWSEEEFEALEVIAYDAAHAIRGLKPYKNTGFYYGMSEGIFTKKLADNDYYVGYLRLADGSYVYSEPKLYGPTVYANNMIGKDSTKQETKDLCIALLNYISAAQMYFDSNTKPQDLANRDLTENQKTIDWDAVSVNMNLSPAVPENKQVPKNAAFAATGKTLLFEEMIALVAIYKIDAEIVSGAKECGSIFWTAEQFAALNGTPGLDNYGSGVKVEGYVQKSGTNNQWYSIAPKVAPKDMADMQYYYLGYIVHEDGTVSYSGVLSYTFEQYIYNTVTKGTASAQMIEFAKRLFVYERAAENALK